MFDFDFCWCASLGLSGSRVALHLGAILIKSVDLKSSPLTGFRV